MPELRAALEPVSPRIAVIIPTLDEAEAIGGVIAEIPRPPVDEIIVADSGSRDGTASIAAAAGARVLALTARGYGRACAAGAAATDAELLVFMDGDGADRADLLPALVAPLLAGTADFVLAARLQLRVLEIPLPYRVRAGGESKVAGSLRGTVKASWRILSTFVRLARRR